MLEAARARSRRSPEKVPLPALQNAARCRNQDDTEHEWDNHHHQLRRRRHRGKQLKEPLPQLAYVYLPPVFPCYEDFETRRRGYSRRRNYDTSESDENSSCSNSSNEHDATCIPLPLKLSMRSQRMRSLAAMSKLQHDAATTIQVLNAQKRL